MINQITHQILLLLTLNPWMVPWQNQIRQVLVAYFALELFCFGVAYWPQTKFLRILILYSACFTLCSIETLNLHSQNDKALSILMAVLGCYLACIRLALLCLA